MDLKKFFGDFFGFNKKISALTSTNNILNKQLSTMKSLLESTKSEDKKLIQQLQAQLLPDPMETFWENRYPKINQTYLRYELDAKYQIDVRDFFQQYDSQVRVVQGATNDEKAFNALQLVKKQVIYTADKKAYNYDEYWAFWFETWNRKIGDCEDGAILLANIMLASGIPYWRIRLNAGMVNGGGHAYVTYCRETDNQFVVLDWCYWPNDLPIKDRKLHKDEQNYDDQGKGYGIWFSWNLKHAFGEMQTMAGMPDYLKGIL